MKYFIDFEFIEGFKKPLFGKRRHFIDMISVGIKCEDGREYYAISNEFNPKDANKWVLKNVISKLPQKRVSFYDSPSAKQKMMLYKNNSMIANDIQGFVYSGIGAYHDFYGYYADYDWVLFCSLFGRMIDLPSGFPMYCRDLKQMLDEEAESFGHAGRVGIDEVIKELKAHPNYPKQTDEHNALSDAKWNYELYKFLTQPKSVKP